MTLTLWQNFTQAKTATWFGSVYNILVVLGEWECAYSG
jgi:hypothetical protein